MGHAISVFQLSNETLEGLNKNNFTIDAILQNHGDQVVDIRI
jgi:hypothetical protein